MVDAELGPGGEDALRRRAVGDDRHLDLVARAQGEEVGRAGRRPSRRIASCASTAARGILDSSDGLDIHVRVPSVDAEAERLSGGQRQAIAVARAVRAATKILLLDEPLAAMGARESRLIVDLVKDLASSGRVSIIVIDHNYAHLFELCDRINVMQEGRIVIDQPIHETSIEQLTELMVSSFKQQLGEA